MTAIEERRSLWEQPWAPYILPLFPAAVFVATLWFLGSSTDAERKLCDRAVAALLHSKDLVEVERAGIIIREVNCGVGRRLMENE